MELYTDQEFKSQQQVWNTIAEEWNEFKKTSDPRVSDFVAKAKGKLIDFGCGSGRNFTKTHAEIYALDFSGEMLKYAKEKAKDLGIKAQFICHDLTTRLPFQDNFFDSAINIATLHCIKGKTNRQNLIKEIYRILKPKAKVLIKVWNKEHKRFKLKVKNSEKYISWRDKGKRYYYFYTEDELIKELGKVGFKIISSSSKSLGAEQMTDDEIIIIAEK